MHFDRDQATGGGRMLDRERLFGNLCNVLVSRRFGRSAGDGIYATGRNLERITVKKKKSSNCDYEIALTSLQTTTLQI